MMAAGFSLFLRAIRARCMSACPRESCGGCPFEPWSERKRQVALFLKRRERIAAARRTAGRATA